MAAHPDHRPVTALGAIIGGVLVASLVAAIAGTSAESSGHGSSPELAYVRGTATSSPQVWLAGRAGVAERRLGIGYRPLISPNGAFVAASLARRTGPALVLYGLAHRASLGFFSAAATTATALAWSADARYLAVALASTDPRNSRRSGLAVIDAAKQTVRIVAPGVVDGASFAPDGTDRIVYAIARKTSVFARVDLAVASTGGQSRLLLTHDGASLNPIWGGRGIAFDRERRRAHAEPVFQIWLIGAAGSAPIQLTHRRVAPLQSGLVPVAFSADGRWLLANSVGLDTNQGWAIALTSHHAHELRLSGGMTTAYGMSNTAATALVDVGGFLQPPSAGRVEIVPLGGGNARVIVRAGSEPTWTGS